MLGDGFGDSAVGIVVVSFLSHKLPFTGPMQPAWPGGELSSPAETAGTLCKGTLLFELYWQDFSCVPV